MKTDFRPSIARIAFTVFPAVLMMVGCASRGPLVRQESMYNFTAEQKSYLASVESAPYRLQRGDLFDLHFPTYPEYSQKGVMVLPDGSASFIALDRVLVAGVSLDELDNLLTSRYGMIVREPDLSIVVREVSDRRVYVMGEVDRPGLYDVPTGGFGILGAVAMAGGFIEHAEKGSVAQIRISPDGYLIREYDLSSLHKGGKYDPALFDLQSFDVIYVSRSAIGDFVSFSKNVIGAISEYTRMVLDLRLIEDPALYRR